MTNHIKTLLLNEDPVCVNQATNAFYVEDSFKPVKLRGSVKVALDRLFNGCGCVEDKVDRARFLFSIVDRVDLSDRLKFYDSRKSDVYGPSSRTGLYVDPDKLFEGTQMSDIFRSTGVKSVDDELLKLKQLSVSSEDGYMSLASKILAVVAQVEGARILEDGR